MSAPISAKSHLPKTSVARLSARSGTNLDQVAKAHRETLDMVCHVGTITQPNGQLRLQLYYISLAIVLTGATT
jgi:hypothetical protein